MRWYSLFFFLVGSACSRPHDETTKNRAPSSTEKVLPVPILGTKARTEARAACVFDKGALPKDTLDDDSPREGAIPIDHFVIVMQENRSFDHYFQELPAFGQPEAEVAPPAYVNPNPTGLGEVVHPRRTKDACIADVPHDWISVHDQIHGGLMNGFVAAANPEGHRAVAYYGADTLGFYYALASTFAIADHYFAAVPGPTYPNRMFMLSASSFGHISNTPPPPQDEEQSIFHQMEESNLSWTIYSDALTFEARIYPRLAREKGHHFRTIAEFHADAAAGKLPNLAWVESAYGGPEATDEHAPANVQLGQAFVAKIAGAVFASPSWSRSALFVTYDEHGGFMDHVPPPSACGIDGVNDDVAHGLSAPHFDRLGVRVPFTVVSPYSKPHYVSHQTYSHTSLLRFVQARFSLPALSRRDANDVPPYDLFDFTHAAFATPPSLPEPVIDETERTRCRERLHGVR